MTFNVLLETSRSFHLSRDLDTELYFIPLNHHSHPWSRALRPQVSLVPARRIRAPLFTEHLLCTKHGLGGSHALFHSYNHLRGQQHPYLTNKETMAQNDHVNGPRFHSQLAAEPSSANFKVDCLMPILSTRVEDVILHILQASLCCLPSFPRFQDEDWKESLPIKWVHNWKVHRSACWSKIWPFIYSFIC